MKFSKTTEYSIRILAFMAKDKEKIFSARFLNANLDIPYKYLTNLLKKLADNDFLISIQGKFGGYKIAKNLKDISLFDIIGAIEGFEVFTRCALGLGKCDSDNPCPMHNEWSKVRDLSLIILKNMTLLKLKDFDGCRI